MTARPDDFFWMQQAIKLAKESAEKQEVPVGAVLVLNDVMISHAHNQPIHLNDPTAHAEMLCIRAAARALNNYRLCDSTLYVTLEPCMMCVGAIIHARIKRVVFGAFDHKAGAVLSCANLFRARFVNHIVDFREGVCEDECKQLLSKFFHNKR